MKGKLRVFLIILNRSKFVRDTFNLESPSSPSRTKLVHTGAANLKPLLRSLNMVYFMPSSYYVIYLLDALPIVSVVLAIASHQQRPQRERRFEGNA
jgi:hypothetical protein